MLPMIKNTEPNPRWEDYDTTETYDSPLGKLYIRKTSPYGFRRLELEKGILPARYSCDWTTLEAARRAKDQFCEEYRYAGKGKKKNAPAV